MSDAKSNLVFEAASAVDTAKTSNVSAAKRLGWHQLPVFGGTLAGAALMASALLCISNLALIRWKQQTKIRHRE